MRSAWAYTNGKREFSRIEAEQKNSIPAWGFVERGTRKVYARRRKNSISNIYELDVIVYANSTQAQKKVEELKEQGVNCEVIKFSRWLIALK